MFPGQKYSLLRRLLLLWLFLLWALLYHPLTCIATLIVYILSLEYLLAGIPFSATRPPFEFSITSDDAAAPEMNGTDISSLSKFSLRAML